MTNMGTFIFKSVLFFHFFCIGSNSYADAVEECVDSNSYCVDPEGTPIPKDVGRFFSSENYKGDNHKDNSCAFKVFNADSKWEVSDVYLNGILEKIPGSKTESELAKKLKLIIGDFSKKICNGGVVVAKTIPAFYGSTIPFYNSRPIKILNINKEFIRYDPGCGLVNDRNPYNLAPKNGVSQIQNFRSCIIQSIGGYSKNAVPDNEVQVTKGSIEKSIEPLQKFSSELNKSWSGFIPKDDTFPYFSVQYCPMDSFDKTRSLLTVAASMAQNLTDNKSYFDSNHSVESLNEFRKKGTSIEDDTLNYGIHTYNKSCMHVQRRIESKPIVVLFEDSSSFLSSEDCTRIKTDVLKEADKKNSKLVSMLLNVSSSTGNNSISKTNSSVKDFEDKIYEKEVYFKKDFNMLTTKRKDAIERCLRMNDKIKGLMVPVSGADKFYEVRYAGMNGDGTSGPCAYKCDPKSSTPKKCVEVDNDKMSNNGQLLKARSVIGNDEQNPYKHFQRAEIVLSTVNTSSAELTGDDYYAVAAMPCYSLAFSCASK